MIHLSSPVNQKIGRALHEFSMLSHGDRVMVAVSGGVDSLVLAWLLPYWRKKAPIDYEILAVHIDNGFAEPTGDRVAAQLERLGVPCRIEQTDFGPRAEAAEDGRSVCYHCSRQRRTRLFSLAQELGMNKIAFGHHRDDLLETFLINVMFGGNISTMMPRQDLFSGRLAIIRPMAFIEKDDIVDLASTLGVFPVKNPCAHDSDSRRQDARRILAHAAALDSRVKSNMFNALRNVRHDYLPAGTGHLQSK